VAEANAHPETFAGKTVGRIADHLDRIVRTLTKKPQSSGTRSAGC
jgi:non-heme chloroperoxidase